MSDEGTPVFDCGDCPLYGGCIGRCSRAFLRTLPPLPPSDLFDAAERNDGGAPVAPVVRIPVGVPLTTDRGRGR